MTRAWYPKGSRPTKTYILNKAQKIHVFGALNIKKVSTKPSPKINSRKFLAFLKRLHKHDKKLCIIIDNARWHLTQPVLGYVQHSRIKMIRLPPYSPELNPIEQYWKNIKQWLATKAIYNKQQLQTELRKALQRKVFIPKISDY